MMPHGSRRTSPNLSPISEASAEEAVIPPLSLVPGHTHHYESSPSVGATRGGDTSHARPKKASSSLDSVVRSSVNDLMNSMSANHTNGRDQTQAPLTRTGRSLDNMVHASYNPFGGSDIVDLLEFDERPIFVIDLKNALNSSGRLNVIFTNKSLRKHTESLNQIMGQSSHHGSPGVSFRFVQWVIKVPSQADACDIPKGAIVFAQFKWTSSVLQRTLKVCRGYSETQRPFSSRSQPASPGIGQSLSFSSNGSEKTPTRERNDYFGSPDTTQSKHNRSHSFDPTSGENSGANRSQSRPVPHREKSGSASKRSSGVFAWSETRSDISKAADIRPPASSPSEDHEDEPFKGLLKEDISMSDDCDPPGFDFTRIPTISHLSKHTQFIKNRPWGLNELGPVDQWCPELRQAVNLIVASPNPAAVYWGESLIIIYNQAYVQVAGPKHPQLMGKAYSQAWSEIWDLIKPTMDSAMRNAATTSKQADLLCIYRKGTRLEECYFDWAIIPILGQDGSVVGVYNPCFEQTRQVVSERQTATLRSISQHTAHAQDMKAFWRGVVKGLGTNPSDAPFAMAFSASQEIESDSPHSSIHSGSDTSIMCSLEDHVGIPRWHAMLRGAHLDLLGSQFPTAILLRKAVTEKGPLHLSIDKATLDPAFLEGIACKVWKEEDECREIVVCPIFVAQREHPLGFLITGVNSRRPYDDEYHLFMIQLSRQIETSMASVILIEDEIAKGQKAARLAAAQQAELTQKLKSTSELAEKKEIQFSILTHMNPTGLFMADPNGNMLYCNQNFLMTMGVKEADTKAGTWMRNISTKDIDVFTGRWNNLIQYRSELDTEVRLDIPWASSSGQLDETYVVVKAKLDISKVDDTVHTILGCIIDISQQKWAEFVESKRKREAEVRKMEQEQFIDMTSHEMRNPLSSILQCADEVSENAEALKKSESLTDAEKKRIDDLSVVSNTLSLCGQHEKRIVDDILTLSKMEAGKLTVSAESADPIELMNTAENMFKFDIKYHEITLEKLADKSYVQLGVKWVNVDPSRVLAVLVNLTTNSIKFTSKEDTRRITITLSASLQPFADTHALTFVQKSDKAHDPTGEPGWGNGEAVYLRYSVSDTGKGLSKKELGKLFQRFAQASDSTHVAYGGSGLGLFIARLLSEVHGGQIGVASTPGVGSTFAFYFKAKRTNVKPVSQEKANFVKPKIPPHVLLVEDNTIVAATAARSLRGQGCTVHRAEDGIECLEILQRSQYYGKRSPNDPKNIRVDVILMDQQMPRMDGLECTREIRRLTNQGKYIDHIPIIGTTANARAEQLETVREAGMDSIVTKPFTMSELFPEIARILARYPGPLPPS